MPDHDSSDPGNRPAIPGYRILGHLGAGGMGTVYLAEDEVLGRKVAIKVVAEKFGGEESVRARQRFLREARSMAKVSHPNVARIYQLGESGGEVYMVMELIEGESLGDRIRRRRQLEAGEALTLTRQIVAGLEAAWELGIIHRDVKPSNVLIDGEDQVKVVDFGLAKPVDAAETVQLTATGFVVGSPHYLAPECVTGEPADLRSDVYSLGVVLYQMLTGRPPFEGDQPLAIVSQHLTSEFPSLAAARPDLSDGVCRLVAWMTARDPASRPSSYGELMAEITRLESEEVAARPPPAAVRPAARRKRTRGRLIAAVVVMVALAASLLVFLGQEDKPPPDRDPEEAGQRVGDPEPPPPPPAPPAVEIGSFPPGAEVLVDGEPIGPAPVRWEAASAAVAIELRKPGYEPTTISWQAGDEPVFAHLRPEPWRLEPGAAGPAVAAELMRLETGAFGIELVPAGGLRVSVRLQRQGYPLLLLVTADGDLYRLWPTGLEAAEVIPAERETVLPPTGEVRLPAGAAGEDGGPLRLFLLVGSAPAAPGVIPGARPELGRYTVYPRHVASRFPAHLYLEAIIAGLRSEAREWDLAALAPGTE